MLIDFHTHCFPDAIAPMVKQKLVYASGGFVCHTDCTLSGLRQSMQEQGVDISVVLHIATNTRQQKKVNDFAASVHNGTDIFSFGSVHPDSPDVMEELERIKSMGLPGVKFHPDYQGFLVDDPKMKAIYRKVSDLGLIMLFHAGLDYGFPPPYCCTPDRLRHALSWFDSPVIAAHWGGCGLGEGVLSQLCGSDIYFDTSFGFGTMPKYYAAKILETHGVDKMLFGTDLPWHTAEMELRLLSTLELSPEEMDQITFGNAKKLLKL